MGKKSLHLALCLALVLALAATAPVQAETVSNATPPVRALVDGVPVAFDKEPVMLDGKVYVHARGLLAALGADVSEVRELGMLKLAADWQDVRLEIRGNSRTALVNGVASDLGGFPRAIGGTLFVPARWLGESLGAKVEWLSATQTITFTFAKEELPRVGSYDHLRALMGEALKRSTSAAGPADMATFQIDSLASGEFMAMKAAGSESKAFGSDYSQTNTQVAGVDEADLIKTDGTHLYQVSGNRVVIIRAVPADAMEIAAEIEFGGNFRPLELYAEPGRLVVIGTSVKPDVRQQPGAKPMTSGQETAKSKSLIRPIDPIMYTTAAYVYDTSDVSSPRLVRELELEGDYLSSRKIGDNLYLVSNKWLDVHRILEGDLPPDWALPLVRDAKHGTLAPDPADDEDGIAEDAGSPVDGDGSAGDAGSSNGGISADGDAGSPEGGNGAPDDAGSSNNGNGAAEDSVSPNDGGGATENANTPEGGDSAAEETVPPVDGQTPPEDADRPDEGENGAGESSDDEESAGELTPVPIDAIRYFPDFIDPNYLLIGSVNLADDAAMDVQVYLGSGQNVYASQDHLYTTVSRYEKAQSADAGQPGVRVLLPRPTDTSTDIYKFALLPGRVEFRAQGNVPGSVLNQFSMDEYDGHFRIATTTGFTWGTGSQQSRNHLFVLDENLEQVGKVTDIAPGERIYSVRFMGERAYMVTFRTVDPLFAIDLSNPSAPKVLGALKIPGYSEYLHPYDENHLIGFGKDTIEISWKDADGNVTGTNAYYLGMKVALFDVTDVEHPIEKHVEYIGDRGTYSDLLTNHKALLFSREKGDLLAFPVDLYEEPGKQQSRKPPRNPEETVPEFGTFTYQGAYVYRVDPVRGFVLRGRITHLDEDELLKAGQFWHNGDRFIRRILYIGDTLFTVSDTMVKANALSDLREIGTLHIPAKN